MYEFERKITIIWFLSKGIHIDESIQKKLDVNFNKIIDLLVELSTSSNSTSTNDPSTIIQARDITSKLLVILTNAPVNDGVSIDCLVNTIQNIYPTVNEKRVKQILGYMKQRKEVVQLDSQNYKLEIEFHNKYNGKFTD